MKENLIQEISNAMTDVLSIEQMAQLNGVLQKTVRKSMKMLLQTTVCLKSFCPQSKLKAVLLRLSNIIVQQSNNFSRLCLKK